MPITKPELWTPPHARERLYLPIVGRVRFQVGYPDHPDKGELEDTGWQKNAIQPFLAYGLWSALSPFDSTCMDRYLDGTNVYPSWADLFAGYVSGSVSVSVNRYNIASGTASTSPLTPSNGTGWIQAVLGSLMAGMTIGNFTGVAPSGTLSAFDPTKWTTYSLIRRFETVAATNNPDSPIGNNDSNYFGPAVNSSTITGAPAPNPTTTVSRTFAAQTGTVNAASFIPMGIAATGAASQSFPIALSGNYPSYWVAQPGGAGTSLSPASFNKTLAVGPGDPFSTSTSLVIASTFFVAASAVVIPTGANLTVSYQLSATL